MATTTATATGEQGNSRPWRCGSCGATLATLALAKGGHARLLVDLVAIAAQEVVGQRVVYACARCGATKTWHTAPPVAESA